MWIEEGLMIANFVFGRPGAWLFGQAYIDRVVR